MGKSGRNLKAALQSQQSRLKAKEKLSHAAQVSEQKHRKQHHPVIANVATSTSAKADNKGKKKAGNAPIRPPTIPFKLTDKILLIGEGNFSYTRALILDPPPRLGFFPPENITATAYDTEAGCFEKYPEAVEIVTLLRAKGVKVLFGVDGTRLEKHPALKGKRWDRIVWNFPHAGMWCLYFCSIRYLTHVAS